MDTRKCCKCGVEKPLDEFYPSKRSRGGRGRYCKPCCAAYYKAYRREHLAELRAADRARYREKHPTMRRDRKTRRCPRCEQVLPLIRFSANGYCKPCSAEYRREWAERTRQDTPATRNLNAAKKRAYRMTKALERLGVRDDR